MSKLNIIRRKEFTENLYSVNFTQHLLEQLYDFICSDQVKSLNYFSEYDKATLLCAIEHLDNYQELTIKK
jgi:hypothetical protein